jgi:biopolymer transport protein ExbD
VTAGLDAGKSGIYFRDRKVTMEELITQFAQNREPDRTVIVKADKQAPSEMVYKITNAAQRYNFTVIWAGSFLDQ